MNKILRAAAVMGASSAVTVGLSAVRYKILALELGAAGVGLIGLLLTALALGTTLFGLGLASSGVRYVASDASAEVRQTYQSALLRGSLVLGALGAVVVTVLGVLITQIAPGVVDSEWLVLGLAVGVFASVVSASQVAVLNGLSRIREMAIVNAGGALAGTLLMIGGLGVSPQLGLVAAVIAPPLATFALSGWFVNGAIERKPITLAEAAPLLRVMAGLGLAFTGGVLVSSLSQFLARVLVSRELGLEPAGYFQASWTIATVYLGFVLSSMAAEYYPRISRISEDLAELNAHVDRQIKIALLLAGPAIVLMIVLAPLLIRLLYSEDFVVAGEVLRWQLLGDVLKVPAWALGFLLMARVAKKKFFTSEVIWNLTFLGGTVVLLPHLGVVATGVAYLVAYAVYLVCILWFSYRESRYKLSLLNVVVLTVLFALSLAAYVVSSRGLHDWQAAVTGAVAVAVAVVLSVLWRRKGRRDHRRVER